MINLHYLQIPQSQHDAALTHTARDSQRDLVRGDLAIEDYVRGNPQRVYEGRLHDDVDSLCERLEAHGIACRIVSVDPWAGQRDEVDNDA